MALVMVRYLAAVKETFGTKFHVLDFNYRDAGRGQVTDHDQGHDWDRGRDWEIIFLKFVGIPQYSLLSLNNFKKIFKIPRNFYQFPSNYLIGAFHSLLELPLKLT